MSDLITESIKQKWKPVIEAEGVDKITDRHQANVMARLLENTVKEGVIQDLTEANDTATNLGANYQDPVLISMVRRSQPLLVANEIVGVQPMSGPTGLIFAFEAVKADGSKLNTVDAANQLPVPTKVDTTLAGDTGVDNFATSAAEALGETSTVDTSVSNAAQAVDKADDWTNLGFKIVKTSVTAQSKALKAHYTIELAQDLKAVHGLDAEAELANILSTEIVAEINRELIDKLSAIAVVGSNLDFSVSALGNFDFRWEGDKFAYLAFAIARESNEIARATGRGRGNFIVTSADVVSALDFAGKISGATSASLNQYNGSISYAGMMNGMKVYVDNFNTSDDVLIGYKGSNQFDAGFFYCPYVPLQMFKGQGEEDFQPRMGFKSRYGTTQHPQAINGNSLNVYYRKMTITSL